MYSRRTPIACGRLRASPRCVSPSASRRAATSPLRHGDGGLRFRTSSWRAARPRTNGPAATRFRTGDGSKSSTSTARLPRKPATARRVEIHRRAHREGDERRAGQDTPRTRSRCARKSATSACASRCAPRGSEERADHEIKWTIKVPNGVAVDLRTVNGGVRTDWPAGRRPRPQHQRRHHRRRPDGHERRCRGHQRRRRNRAGQRCPTDGDRSSSRASTAASACRCPPTARPTSRPLRQWRDLSHRPRARDQSASKRVAGSTAS